MSAPELYHDFRIGRWKIGDPEETMIRIPDEVLQCHFATSSTFQAVRLAELPGTERSANSNEVSVSVIMGVSESFLDAG
jgi:hypothetical protein